MRVRSVLFLALTLTAAALFAEDAQPQQPFSIDKAHSSATFSVRHLMTNVPGRFRDVDGAINIVPDNPGASSVEFTIQAASIDTANENRDKHLRSADFFDVEKFPTITFTSSEVTDATDTSAKLHGRLAMHGVEKPVVLDLQMHGEGKDPWGNVRAGFTATTKLNRKDFGIIWNQALETGGALLGDDVDITLEIEGLVKQP